MTPEKPSAGADVAARAPETMSDADVLRDSFALVVARRPDVAHRFYEVLFVRHPAAEGLFRRNGRTRQERMLAEALGAVIEFADDPAWLKANLTALGAKHAGYGVADEMYDWVGASLLATFAEIAGSDWTPDVERAWTAAYEMVAVLMKRGASAARP